MAWSPSMMLSHEFWRACFHGDLTTVTSLLQERPQGLDINRSFGILDSPALCLSATFGHLEILQLLLNQPDMVVAECVNLWQETPLWIGCERKDEAVVTLLLADGRIDPNKPDERTGQSPLAVASLLAGEHIVLLLLQDHRVDINAGWRTGRSPLAAAAEAGNLDIARTLLLHERRAPNGSMGADSNGRQVEGAMDLNVNVNLLADDGESPLQIAAKNGHYDIVAAILALARDPAAQVRTEDVKAARRAGHGRVAGLLTKYMENAWKARDELWAGESSCQSLLAAEVFALVVFASDGYLCVSAAPNPFGQDDVRFFAIATKLPMELQMVLCNRLFGLGIGLVATRNVELALRWVGRHLAAGL